MQITHEESAKHAQHALLQHFPPPFVINQLPMAYPSDSQKALMPWMQNGKVLRGTQSVRHEFKPYLN
jgi:hypothetical protein